MRGCLSLPFRLLGLALLVLAGYAAWSYRREIKHQIHEWTAEGAASGAEARAEPGAMNRVIRRLDSLGRDRADSVVLRAGEVAGSLETLAARLVPGAIDSVTVTLDRDDILVRARVDTRKVPVALGPVAGMMRDHEWVEAGGRLVFRRAGVAEWDVERVRMRGFPVPTDLVDRLLRQFGAPTTGTGLVIPLPPAITGLRVSARGVVLYGQGAAGVIR